MSPQETQLATLLFEVSNHYRLRGFDADSLAFLRWTIVANTHSGVLALDTALHRSFTRQIDKLLGHFREPTPIPANDAELQSKNLDAIFAFSFGYRLPNPRNQAPMTRISGSNNDALAQIAGQLKGFLGAPLFAQFEIAQAIPRFAATPGNYSSEIDDMSTATAIEQFLRTARQAASPLAPLERVAVVAHGHHLERCIRTLEQKRFGIKGFPSQHQYSAYDSQECQPRVMSPREYIVSDFVSMAAMCM